MADENIRFLWENKWTEATITSSSEATGFPDTNTQHRWQTYCWQTTDDTAEWIKVDLTTAQNIKALVINNHNFTGAATLKIQAHADDAHWGAPDLDDTLAITDGKVVKFWSSNQSYRWWRISIEDAANPDTYIKIGHVFLGSYFEPAVNYQHRTVTLTDPSIVKMSTGGQISVNEKTHYKTISYSFPSLTEAEVVTLKSIFDEVGISKCWYICQNAGHSDGAYTVTFYVRNTNSWEISPLHPAIVYEKLAITVETQR